MTLGWKWHWKSRSRHCKSLIKHVNTIYALFCLCLLFRAEEQQKAKPSNDLLDLDFGNPTAKSSVPERDLKNDLDQPPPPPRTIGASIDPWGMASDTVSPALTDATGISKKNDPWRPTTSSTATYNDEASGAVATAVDTSPPTMPKSKDPWSPVSSVCTLSTDKATASINLKSGTSISDSCKSSFFFAYQINLGFFKIG